MKKRTLISIIFITVVVGAFFRTTVFLCNSPHAVYRNPTMKTSPLERINQRHGGIPKTSVELLDILTNEKNLDYQKNINELSFIKVKNYSLQSSEMSGNGFGVFFNNNARYYDSRTYIVEFEDGETHEFLYQAQNYGYVICPYVFMGGYFPPSETLTYIGEVLN